MIQESFPNGGNTSGPPGLVPRHKVDAVPMNDEGHASWGEFPHLAVQDVLQSEFDTVDPQHDRTPGECEHHVALREVALLPVDAFKHAGSHGVNSRPQVEVLKVSRS